MSIHLITGYAGTGHVTAADAGRFNAGVCGLTKYVMETGTKFAYEFTDNNTMVIGSGDLVNQGRHINIPQNSTEIATIANGTQNRTRIDTVIIRYTKDTSTGIESASTMVLRGEDVTSGGTPVPADLTTGNIYNGDPVDDFPLYYVTLDGLNITKIEQAFTIIPSLGSLIDKVYPVGSIYMSVNAANPSTYLGGTWQALQGRFLIGAGGDYTGGSTGGASSKTLSESEIPSHTHSIPGHTHTVPNHTHTVPAHGHTASSASAGAHKHDIYRNKVAASGTARYAVQGSAD